MEEQTMNQNQMQFADASQEADHWRNIYLVGMISTVLALAGILLDVVIGNITGGNLAELPQTAVERFLQFNDNKFIGLYNLDFLNILIQLVLIPGYFALYGVHRSTNRPLAALALIVFLLGTALFVANNAALPMMELSNKYFASALDSQKELYAAAGEALLASGTHGSLGAFLGFFIPNIAGLIFSVVMLKGRVFSRANSWLGIIGSILILFYLLLVTVAPGVKSMATAFAMPGGILLMIWMILFSIRFYKLSRPFNTHL